jgi:hypothetical protein
VPIEVIAKPNEEGQDDRDRQPDRGARLFRIYHLRLCLRKIAAQTGFLIWTRTSWSFSFQLERRCFTLVGVQVAHPATDWDCRDLSSCRMTWAAHAAANGAWMDAIVPSQHRHQQQDDAHRFDRHNRTWRLVRAAGATLIADRTNNRCDRAAFLIDRVHVITCKCDAGTLSRCDQRLLQRIARL